MGLPEEKQQKVTTPDLAPQRRGGDGSSSDPQPTRKPGLAELAAQVLSGEMSLADAAAQMPTLVAFLQATLGNEAVAQMLAGGEAEAKQAGPGDEEQVEAEGEQVDGGEASPSGGASEAPVGRQALTVIAGGAGATGAASGGGASEVDPQAQVELGNALQAKEEEKQTRKLAKKRPSRGAASSRAQDPTATPPSSAGGGETSAAVPSPQGAGEEARALVQDVQAHREADPEGGATSARSGDEEKVADEVARTAQEQDRAEVQVDPSMQPSPRPEATGGTDLQQASDPATDGSMPSDEEILEEVTGRQDDKESPVADEAKKTEAKVGGESEGALPGTAGDVVPGGAAVPGLATEAKENAGGAGGAGGAESEAVPAADAGGDVVAVPEGPGGTLDEYMANNPDPAAAESVANARMVTDKLGRNANELHGKIDLPPDKSWIDAVHFRQDWFKLKQAVKGNKWSGQDTALAFMTNLNATIDFISGVAGKVGLAATVSGAILTLLVPPVGAFLLAVGRVMNAVSLACAAVRAISSVITTVMLAVKAAKEKDPAKRLEMMQEMKANVQAGVMAGIEIVMSKLGGAGKNGAAKAGGKGLNAAKATWAEAGGLKGALKQGFQEGGLKGALKAGGGLVKETVGAGLGAAKDGLKQSWKEGVQGLKNSLSTMKQLGVGGTLKQGLSAAGGALKTKFVKPLTDLPTAFKSFGTSVKTLTTDWSAFRAAVRSDGYFATIKAMNFPNFGREGLKGLKTDLLDTTGGGWASRVHMGMNGAPKKKESKLPGEKPDERSDLQRSIDEQKEKLARLERAQNGSRADKIKALHGDDMGAPQRALYDQGKKDGDISTRLAAFRGRKGAELDDGSLDLLLDQKIKETRASQNLLAPKSYGAAGWDLAKSGLDLAIGKGDFGDLAKTGLSHMGTAGSNASKFMVNSETAAQKAGKKKSLLQKLQDDNDARTKKATESLVSDVQGAPQYGVTQGKVQATVAPVLGLFQERTSQIQEAMSATPGGRATDTSVDTGGSAPASSLPPPPPAPPEGMTVPDAGLLEDIAGQRKALASYKAAVQADIDQAKVYKEQAIGGDAKLVQYAEGLEAQSAEIAKENEAAKQDTADVQKSKEDLAAGGKSIAEGAQKAEGEKNKTEAEADKGSSLSVEPDEAKKRAEEEKDARKREADFQREYRNAGYLRRKYLEAKKWLFSFANLLKKAAEWVWKKMIAPAIKAVKAALAKVMNFITNMMMSGILKLVKLFLSKEEANRLDETFAQMKELEAKQAEAATQETADKNAEAKKQLDEARQAAATKIETCQKNIDEGTALIGAIDAHDKTLEGEYAKVDGARKAFIAQYTPYFDWVKLRDAQPAAEEAQAGAEEKEGGPAGQEHPVDRPLSPSVGEALSAACGIVKEDSLAAEQEIASKSAEQRDKVHKAAWGVYDANRRDIAVAAVGVLAPSVDAVTPLYDHEQGRVRAIQSAADAVHANVTGAMAASEAARRGRLDALASEAATVSTLPAASGAAKARDIYERLAAEAKGIDDARSEAYAAMRDGYAQAARSGV